MADRTGIEWCDSTWNPWIGCTRVSPACDHCYAAASTPARTLGIAWGAGQPRRRTSPSNWSMPLLWNVRAFAQCPSCGWRGEARECVSFPHPDDQMPTRACPACRSAGVRDARRRVFCASLADVFDNEVDPRWRIDLLELIAATPNLDWLLLTKRIGNAERMLDVALDVLSHGLTRWRDAPWPNVWLGATICNQTEANRDVPKLLAVPAAVRFLSMEPLLGPVNLVKVWVPNGILRNMVPAIAKLDWVIAGGESGPHARPMHPEWARSLRDQCAAAGVPFLFKQWGEWQVASLENGHYGCVMPDTRERYTWLGADGRTSNPSAIGLPDAYAMARVGKKAAGRVLDGRMHTACPEVAIG